MIKRKFGMACLNISQGRYGSYSHKYYNAYDLAGVDAGIDKFVTFMPLIFLGVQRYATTGFANTMYFYDEDNDITLALTHCNDSLLPNFKIGANVPEETIIYYEGTTGQATGNHIHMEIGKGKQSSKIKKSFGWALENWVNMEDYFYIDTNYTTIKDANGYTFETEKDISMNLIDGYQEIKWCSQTVHFYKQKDDQFIGLVSAAGADMTTNRQTIDKIDYNKDIYTKINCNFFNMSSNVHYGVEQGLNNDLAPKQDAWYCLYLNKDTNEPEYTLSSNYWLRKDDVILACSPSAILRHNGVDVDIVSTGANTDPLVYLSQKTQHTLLLHLGNGRYAFMTTEGTLTLYQCRDCAKTYGAVGVYALDGGGSSQMIVNGVKKQYTGRPLANVLCFYNDGKEDDDMLKTIHVDKVGMYIRNAVKGTIIGYIPKGSSYTFDKVEPIANRQSDGYQWWKVTGSWFYNGNTYTNQVGYCQYDSSCYWVE